MANSQDQSPSLWRKLLTVALILLAIVTVTLGANALSKDEGLLMVTFHLLSCCILAYFYIKISN